ncbi:hypothetical protein ONE63_008046 [Megalurothrips usitatus]|uniref:PHD-type domain-containing protein n=1 Tax=Megalurothrips usitatus TaxID=439358 RepID=A0AAV7XS40_9NEOP|nr:hypothetical protein ONE63_008046 [Megalurothrips usitatus]
MDCDTGETRCLCGKPEGFNRFMIYCNGCRFWFHGSCVGITKGKAQRLPEKWFCVVCASASQSVANTNKDLYRVQEIQKDICGLKQEVSTLNNALQQFLTKNDSAIIGEMEGVIMRQSVETSDLRTELGEEKNAHHNLVLKYNQSKELWKSERETYMKSLEQKQNEISKLEVEMLLTKEKTESEGFKFETKFMEVKNAHQDLLVKHHQSKELWELEIMALKEKHKKALQEKDEKISKLEAGMFSAFGYADDDDFKQPKSKLLKKCVN